MTLTFLGAAGTVTGSKHLVTIGDRRVLVDAGLFQGEKRWREMNWAKFPVDPGSISDLLLTHAHLDHCGYIPALVKAGFRGTIWCTPDTIELAEIVLMDSAHLQEQDAKDAAEGGWSKHNPPLALYTQEDVQTTMRLFRPIDFDVDVDLREGLMVRLTRAGHILGSACVNLTHEGRSILFSGDLGRHDHPVLKPRGVPQGADHVLMESTYGDREHPEPEGLPHEEFAETIRRTVARGGSVLVPAFAVDRTEAVLKVVTEMRKAGRIPEVPVFVNSPMALAALKVYRSSEELRPDIHVDDFTDLKGLREVTSAEESMALNDPKFPCIIISSSGMATGGRVVHHLEHMLPDPRHSVVLTGYQGAGTRGRMLLDGAKELKMHGRYVPVRATIVQDKEFSVHADCSDLLDWLRDLPRKPRTVYLVHGEPDSAEALKQRIVTEFGITCVVPRHGEVVSVEAGAAQPAPEVPTPDHVGSPVVVPPATTTPAPSASGGLTTLQLANRMARALESGDGAALAQVLAGPVLVDGATADTSVWAQELRGFELVDLVDAGRRAVARGLAAGREVVLFLSLDGGRITGVEQVGGPRPASPGSSVLGGSAPQPAPQAPDSPVDRAPAGQED
ncbi:MBL fold metallo-hydrolase RNA specificity domain-containing protein [Luteococcus peritonei]|uniref:MBL fold metallo-hydrolase RNA specificity domain-containing protein n=1 Tax=Luteococcus peritonei TaxID=88874 RepID=A0ABW4RUL2_9ACTN